MSDAQKPWNRVEEPVLVEDHPLHGQKFDHPAFGQIAIFRSSANPGVALYDSEFRHHNYMTIELSRSQLCRSNSHDRFFPKEEMLRIEMSEAQWATFVSSFGMGSGVPCTIKRFGTEIAPQIALRSTKPLYEKEGMETINRVTEILDELKETINTEGAKLTFKAKDAIFEKLRRAKQEIASNLPFVSKSFAEHIEKTVEKGKVELHGYIASTLRSHGLEALNSPIETPKQIEDKSK